MDAWFSHVKDGMNNRAYIHKDAKFHYYVNNKSLCGSCIMDTDYYETNIDDDKIKLDSSIACKKCYKKWCKLQSNNS